MRRTPLLTCIVAAFVLGAAEPCRAQSAKRPPNFVIFLADDLGYNDVGFNGSKIKTPNLDRLAADSLILSQHYATPMCTPTRAALLSGRYASRFGNNAAGNDRVFPFDTVTLASALKTLNYLAALIGKWHLGSLLDWGPHRYGFDWTYGSLAGGVGPFDHLYKKGPYLRTWQRNGKFVDEEGHVTDLIAREAIDWLKQRDAGKPFLLYVPFTAPHHPIAEPKEWEDLNKHIPEGGPRLLAASVSHLDDAIGRVVAELERQKLADNTVVLFFSDNGAPQTSGSGDVAQYPGTYRLAGPGSNAPFRGYKQTVYEGGIRVPAFVRWPGKLKPGKFDAPVHAADWMPTFTKLAGYEPKQNLKWDGMDAWPLLTGQSKPSPRVLYWQGVNKQDSALREGDWILIVTRKGKAEELYSLADDPGQQRNVAAQNRSVVERLRRLLKEQEGRDNDAVVPKGK